MRLTILVLTIFVSGCASTSVSSTMAQNNKDVVILSALVRDHFRSTRGEGAVDLNNLIEKDALNRISGNFQSLEFKSKGAHISVYYTFSESRKLTGIELTNEEKELVTLLRWKAKKIRNDCDGEIQLDYGERFYRLLRIVVNKPGQ